MLILWTVLITTIAAQKVYESTEVIGPEAFQNVTTLYPISNNKTLHTATNKDTLINNNNNTNFKAGNDSSSKEKYGKKKLDATVWKIEAAFAESNLDKQENDKENTNNTDITDKKNDTREFRPSLHLGSFYDEDTQHVTPTRASFGSYTPHKKPSSGFVSFVNNDHHSFNKIPKQVLQSDKLYPYKFESPILTRFKAPWKAKVLPEDSLESRPTAEVPVKIPAGGLYKYQDPFKEKPGSEQDENFGVDFNDGKDHPVKKRENPWESLLRLVTAFLPVGLIISALTPSIITIENTAGGTSGNTYPTNMYRRSDPGPAQVPHISERCRRRLLCELHSDNNYKPTQNPPRQGKQCYKIRCDDTEALARTLKWLLEYRQYASDGPPYN